MKLTHKFITLFMAALMLISSAGVVVFKMVCLTGEGETKISLWETASSCTHEKKEVTKKSCCHAELETNTEEESKPCCHFSHNYVKLDKVTTPPTTASFHFNAPCDIVPTFLSLVNIGPLVASKKTVSLYSKPPPNSSGKSLLISIQTFRI